MAELSGFFNALLSDGVYDRTYNADDYCNILQAIISDGVRRSSSDDLKVTASGMTVSVASGWAFIKGHYYKNTASKSYTVPTAPTAGNRWDRIVLRFDNSVSTRDIHLVYVQGIAATTPTKPTPTRTESLFELVLADIYVATNATTVVVTDTRSDTSVCGWVYSTAGDNSFFTSLDSNFTTWFNEKKNTLSSVTLFKKYDWRTVLASASASVSFSISQYDANTCFLEVFVNGILETATTDYTISGTVITFSGTLTAGTEVEVKCYKSIDGTGIMDVSDEITELQNQYATLNGISKYTYKCTGLNDNIALSQIAQAFIDGSYTVGSLSTAAETFLSAIGGNTYLANFGSEGQITIDVVGTLGATTPYSGSGTSSSRYRWFQFGQASATGKKICFDFAKCNKINISCPASSYNIIFYGTDIYMKNIFLVAQSAGANCNIQMLVGSYVGGDVNLEGCRLKAIATGYSYIANYGTFNDCILHTKASSGDSACIVGVSAGYVTLSNCSLYSYRASTSYKADCISVASGQNARIVATALRCPTVAQTGYTQNRCVAVEGGTTFLCGVMSSLSTSGGSTYLTVLGKMNG